MLKTSLIEILRTLSKDEFKKFDDFVNSPYFNKKSTVTKLWLTIRNYSPDYDSVNLDRKNIYKELFSGKEFNYGVMKNLIYDLTQLAERFLTEEEFDRAEFRKAELSLYGLTDKGLNKSYISKNKVVKEKLYKSKKSADYYEQIATLNWIENSVTESDKINRDCLNQISEYTIYSFLINLFKLYNNVCADKLTFNFSYSYNLLEEFINKLDLEFLMNFISQNSYEDYKIINIYYDMYKAISNPNEDKFFYKFKQNLSENEELITEFEIKNLSVCLWTSLANNTVIKNKTTEYMELIKNRNAKNLFLEFDGTISIREFTLSIRIAAMMKDIDFIEKFINNYSKYLLPSARKNMELYGNAYLNFAKDNFEDSLALVNKINIDLISFKYELKNLQIMLFYELNDFDSLMYALDSFKHFASGNKFVSESQRQYISGFIKYVSALYKLKENPDKIKIELLSKQIQNDSLNTKNWLLDKIKELKK